MCGRGPTAAGTRLNSDTLPRVLVNQSIIRASKTIARTATNPISTDCLQNATWLWRALDQRARTILKVGPRSCAAGRLLHPRRAHLRPLNLKAVADAIQMHESTVSRVTAKVHGDQSRAVSN